MLLVTMLYTISGGKKKKKIDDTIIKYRFPLNYTLM